MGKIFTSTASNKTFPAFDSGLKNLLIKRVRVLGLTRWVLIGLLAGLISLPTVASVVRSVSIADSSSNASDGDSVAPIITPDGRFVLFASTADNLVLTTNGLPLQTSFPARFNVFLRDRTNNTTTLISVNMSGSGGGNGDSMPMGISTNGRYALFETTASNLIANDTNNASDVFVRDLVNNTNMLVSVNMIGRVGNGNSSGSVLTPDGRFVAFVSAASNLVSGDQNTIPDIFVRDLQLGITVWASPYQVLTNSFYTSSESPEISDDGRYVAFYSTATNLIPGVVRGGELYVRDIVNSVTLLASTNARTALFTVTGNSNSISYNHAISADGKFVAFVVSPTTNQFSGIILRYSLDSGITDLVHTNALVFAGLREDMRTLDITPDGRFIVFLANTKTNLGLGTVPSVCVWDAQTGVTTLVTKDTTNEVAIGSFEWPAIDSTGRFVSFTSTATNLTTNSLSGCHAYVRDLLLEQTTLVDASSEVSAFAIPCLSMYGRFVAFQALDGESGAINPRRNSNLYLRDLQTNTTELISVAHSALSFLSPDGSSALSSLSLSANGRYIAFASLASNLVTNDTNTNRDVFLRDLFYETNILVSWNQWIFCCWNVV
jgi:hypothetical protein